MMNFEPSIQAALSGNAKAYEFLRKVTYQDAYARALALVESDPDAQRIVQEAYDQAFRTLDTLPDPAMFPVWLLEIVEQIAGREKKTQGVPPFMPPDSISTTVTPTTAQVTTTTVTTQPMGSSFGGAVATGPAGYAAPAAPMAPAAPAKAGFLTTTAAKVTCIAVATVVVCGAILGGAAVVSGSGDSKAHSPQTAAQSGDSASQASGEAASDQTAETAPNPADVALANSYTTRFGSANAVTFPAFTFNFPEGWSVISEEVAPFSEVVTIGNASGAQITYSYFMGSSVPPTPAHTARTANITPIANSSFVPGYVQGDSYAGLGAFDVMKVASPDGGGDIGYASMPQSMAGDGVGIAGTTDIALAFDYAGKMSFALTGGGSLTPQDEAEVVAIISSFRPSGEALQPVTLL